MQKIVLLIASFIISLGLSAREIYNFNDNWKFSTSFKINNEGRTITLPHVWGALDDNTSSNPLYRGACYYLKEFNVSDKLKGKELFLRFGGVGSVATIFVNGKYAYEHKGAFTAFNVNITPFIRYGTYNSILVVVSNAPRLDVLPFMSENHIFGGIHAPVELIAVDLNHFSLSHYGSKGIYLQTKNITSSAAEIDATVMVTGEPQKVVTVDLAVINGDKQEALGSRNLRLDSRGEGKVIIPLNINNPMLWQGIDNPHLYKVKATLNISNSISDSLYVDFGVRKFEINENNEFVLNGKPMRLKGVNVFQDNLSSGSAYNNSDFIKDVSLIKEIGANAVRMQGSPHSQQAFQFYDREGLVSWVDLPFSSDAKYGGKAFADIFYFKDNAKQQLLEMIYQLYNHPSICFWGIFNEISTTGDSPTNFIEELNSIARSASSDRITVGSSMEDGAINQITQAISWPIYFGWEKGDITDFEVWIKQISTGFKHLKSAISEYGAAADFKTFVKKDDDLKKIVFENGNEMSNTQNSQSLFHQHYYEILEQNPIFWGTFINSMFDYSSPDREGAFKNGYNNIGLVSYDRSNKKDAFYFYKANWNKDDSFVYIANKDYTRRSGKLHTIKAFTNQPSAKLIVNGQLISEGEAKFGTIVWENVEMPNGVNRIIVTAGANSDITEVEIYNDLLAQ